MFRVLIICSLLLPAVSSAELLITDAWIRSLPPSVPMRAGYLTIHNLDHESLTIVGLKSAAFSKIEIHNSIEQDGTVRMERVPELTISANGTVELAPGGLHLMMVQPLSPIKQSEIIKVTIIFDNDREQTLEMTVK